MGYVRSIGLSTAAGQAGNPFGRSTGMAFFLVPVPRVRKEVRTPDSGVFPCPHCREDNNFTIVAIHANSGLLGRFRSGGGNPLAELLVECSVCSEHFPASVRDRPLFRDR
jgi:hypothetical protein